MYINLLGAFVKWTLNVKIINWVSFGSLVSRRSIRYPKLGGKTWWWDDGLRSRHRLTGNTYLTFSCAWPVVFSLICFYWDNMHLLFSVHMFTFGKSRNSLCIVVKYSALIIECMSMKHIWRVICKKMQKFVIHNSQNCFELFKNKLVKHRFKQRKVLFIQAKKN